MEWMPRPRLPGSPLRYFISSLEVIRFDGFFSASLPLDHRWRWRFDEVCVMINGEMHYH
jgi:hypothetical protein